MAMLLPGAAAFAQAAPQREVVLPIENVRFDYAQVLAVRPISQVLRTTNMERVCRDPAHPERMIPDAPANSSAGRSGRQPQSGMRNCKMAPVVREFRRTISYEVDYIYRGARFRTRMDRDPGNRLRIRISIMPAPLD